MYIPLCIFFDGVSSTGQMAETDFDPDGILITYFTAQGEKKETPMSSRHCFPMINPEGMVQLLNLLNKEVRSKDIPSYLSTHPDTETRIADVKDYINSVNIRIIHNKLRTHIWDELKHSSAK